jgi:hypothetical protein
LFKAAARATQSVVFPALPRSAAMTSLGQDRLMLHRL